MDSTTTDLQGEEDWRTISDPKRRKRVQNRISQRRRRQKLHQMYNGEASDSSQQATNLNESAENFGMGDILADLGLSPGPQNEQSEAFLNTEDGSLDDLFGQDLFSVDGFQGNFDPLDTMELVDDPRPSTTDVSREEQNASTQSACCCGNQHSHTSLVASGPPSSPRQPSLPLAEPRKSESFACNHMHSHSIPQSYRRGSHLGPGSSFSRAQIIDNWSPSTPGFPQRRPSAPAPSFERAQLVDTNRTGRPSFSATSYRNNHQRQLTSPSDNRCDHVECQHYNSPCPHMDIRTQQARPGSSHQRRADIRASIDHDILAEHGLDLADILRVSSRTCRQSSLSYCDGDSAMTPQSSNRGRHLRAVVLPDRGIGAPSTTETEVKCDKVVIVYLRGEGADGGG